MFSKILDCPECKFRFQYDYENELPEIITCPSCKNSTSAENYAALIFCPECRAKLKIPLTIINDPDNICPQCGCNLKAATLLEENKFTATFADNNEDIHQLYKRMLQDGEIFDKYEIIRLLGKGGMAEVYLAKHRLLNQQCALKLMRCGMESENPVFIKRFLREAKLLYQIDHPNIVKVFDVGSDFTSGHLFIAMEYIAGMTLHEKLRQGLYSEDELKNVAVTMAHALQALADAHVVHRDIKPSNIMLTSSGELKLMDLGIAKFSNSQAGEMTLTMEQSTIGTPNYASPEQCRSAHNTDIRSDIYSLGASLYHLASGKLPFDGHTPMETILQVLQKEAVPLKNFRPDLSRKMLNVIEAMMQKNPDDRPANPDQLLALLYGNNRKFPAIKRFNPLKWFKKDTPGAAPAPRKLLPAAVKVLISAALLGLIALNVNYIIKKVKHNQRVRAQQQTAQKPHRAPSASGIQNQQARSRQRTASSISRPATATSNYRPTVVFKSFTPQQQIAHWEFDQALQAKDGSFFNIQDGIMYARGSRSKTSAEHLKYLPLDLPENCQELTVSMDLKVQHGNGYIVKLQPDLIIGKYDNTLMLICAAASHRFSFPFMNDVPIDKWFNLTISCDKAQRELKIFSGNRLLRKVRISPRASNVITQVGFFEAAPLEICNTAVERITVFNSCISEEKVTRERKAVIAAVERIPAAEITKTVAPAPSAATPVDKEDAEQKKNVAANSEFRIFTEFDQAQKAAAAEQKNLLVIWDNRSIPIHVEQITMLLDKYPSLKSRIPQKFITVFLNSPPGSPQTAQLQNIIQRNSHFRPGNAEKKLLSCLTITPAGKIVHELRTTGSLSATIFYQALDWAMYYKSGANNLARSRPRPIPQVNINFSSWQLSAINKDYLVNYPAALQMAEQKKLPILVLFTQTGHTGSEKLLERIKSNQAFQEYLSKNFVVLHIALVNDADNTFSAAQKLHNAQLALRSSINSPDRLPAFTICNFQGTILYTRSHITTNTGLLERHLRKHLPSIRQSTDFITGNRTVAKRLQEVSYKLKMIRKSTGTLKNDDFYTGCVKYLNQQINVLKQQMQYQQLAKKNLDYSLAKTQSLRKAVEAYLASNTYSSDKLSDIADRLKDRAVNPNITINAAHKGVRVPLWELVISNDIKSYNFKEKMLKILQEKYVNVNTQTRAKTSRFPVEIYYMGKDDIDSGESHPFFTIASGFNRYFNTLTNKHIVEKLNKYLLLAPLLTQANYKYDDNTAMHWAAKFDNSEVAEKLLYLGFADPYRTNKNNLTPWRLALRSGSKKMVELLKRYGFQTPEDPSDHLQFEFWQALQMGDHAKIQQLLDKNADPYSLSCNNLNAIQTVCQNNDIETLKLLLKNNVIIANPGVIFNDPLRIAILNKNTEIMELILRSKAHYMHPGYMRSRARSIPQAVIQATYKDKSADQAIAMFKILQKYDLFANTIDRYNNELFTLWHLLTNSTHNMQYQKEIIEFLLQAGLLSVDSAPEHFLQRIQDTQLRNRLLQEYYKKYPNRRRSHGR